MKISIKKEFEKSYLDVEDLKELFDDISIIKYYTIEDNKDGSFILTVYDKNQNIIKPKKSINENTP